MQNKLQPLLWAYEPLDVIFIAGDHMQCLDGLCGLSVVNTGMASFLGLSCMWGER